ncbi:response regulator [Aquimarina algicola]|uniref:histidine kinase n=1 Tax=Aquimarina algicola TaxID=2589995 RepID=A0A504J2P0_9FLAO|nr:transporter substrate-binding domain-containing protein [Aquimarina algicola]TPN85127.1 transporter substrate-binding domain-containing protein [Aquimarina algicola]
MYIKKLLYILFIFSTCFIALISCNKQTPITDEEKDWLANQDNITIALSPDYPPYQFINEDNTIEGLSIEYISLIEEKLNHKFKRKYYQEWPRLMEDVKKGKIDITTQIQATKNRKKYLNFYSEFFTSKHVITVRKGTSQGDKISDYKNKEITVPQDYAVFENLTRKYPNQKFIEDKSDLVCLKKLNAGQYDAYIGPKAIVNYLIKTQNLDNLEIIAETELYYKPGIAIDKKNKMLNSIFIKAEKSISENEKQNIAENWLYTAKKPFYKKASFWISCISVIIACFILSLGLNFYLSYMVKQKTKELRLAKNMAEKDNQLKTAFINNISHEIRTPMNGIIGFSKFLEEPDITKDEKANYIDIVIKSSKELINTIDNILEVSKLQTKQVIFSPEETDLFEIFDIIFLKFEKKVKSKSISLILNKNIEDHQRYIITDRSKLIKIISALVENAIKFTKKGAILVSCSIKNQTLIITVRDSGIGIDEKDQEIIFNIFSQSENQIARKYGGLGLGLAIAKENVSIMKGQIVFSSIPQKGSTFRIEIPYTANPKKYNEQTITNKYEKPTTPSNRILIAEDGDVNFLILKTLLNKIDEYHFIINRVHNGKEAVLFYEENNEIDLIFMDIKMPIMNGYNATKLIKSLDKSIPIIAQTAYTTKEDIQNAYKAGCDDFISKPIDLIELKKVINKYLPINTTTSPII